MGNMSYCRFENTANDLQDCLNAINRGETDELNEYEVQGLRRIIDMSNDIVDMEDFLTEIIESYA
tara:strand:+ start:236 stop:430 length:195 start_codon:yes stop_codon:yes gene_type:complete